MSFVIITALNTKSEQTVIIFETPRITSGTTAFHSLAKDYLQGHKNTNSREVSQIIHVHDAH